MHDNTFLHKLLFKCHFHTVSGRYIHQYVNSSLRALTKMAKIGTWRIITNLQYNIFVQFSIHLPSVLFPHQHHVPWWADTMQTKPSSHRRDWHTQCFRWYRDCWTCDYPSHPQSSLGTSYPTRNIEAKIQTTNCISLLPLMPMYPNDVLNFYGMLFLRHLFEDLRVHLQMDFPLAQCMIKFLGLRDSNHLSFIFGIIYNTPEWKHSKERMCRLRNIATCVTTKKLWLSHRHTNKWTDKCQTKLSLCATMLQKTQKLVTTKKLKRRITLYKPVYLVSPWVLHKSCQIFYLEFSCQSVCHHTWISCKINKMTICFLLALKTPLNLNLHIKLRTMNECSENRP